MKNKKNTTRNAGKLVFTVGGLVDIGPNWMLRIKDILFCHFANVCNEAD